MRNVAILFLAVVFVGNAIADSHYSSTVPAVDATGQPVQLKSDHAATKTSTQRRLHYREAMGVVRKHYGRVPLKWWLAQPYAVWYRSLVGR